MHDEKPADETARQFRWGADDVLTAPLAAIGVAVKTLARWTWRILVHIIDYAFPIFLQVARFVLFTFRILGDALSGMLRLFIRILPLPKGRRNSWREAVARGWSWIRRKISYRAFEEWLHHLFEDGMAWTFRTCRKLSPTGAMLVILAAMIWVPVSFLAATAVHTWLIAEAANLPAWMQVFHGVATILAKSKLLMLPAYPAAWPQAKKHPIVAAGLRVVRAIARWSFVRKLIYRFGRIDDALHRWAVSMGIVGAWDAVLEGIARVLAAIGNGIRAVVRPVIRWLTKVPVLGPVVRTYESHYDRAGEAKPQKVSQKIRAFFDRWEIKFMPSYYEAKEREKQEAAKRVSSAANDSA